MEETARGAKEFLQGRAVLLPSRPLGGALRLDLRRHPLRPHEYVPRGRRNEGSRKRTPALRLQPRQTRRLSSGRGRSRPYTRRIPPRLRGHARQHERPRNSDAVHQEARGEIRRDRQPLADGQGRSNGEDAQGDAQGRVQIPRRRTARASQSPRGQAGEGRMSRTESR